MKRTVIKIDEQLCNGCGNCVKGCHEGALQLINGKAVMISELYCDGLGACIGDCPAGAIGLTEKEAEPYDEQAVMERISKKGDNVIVAHLKHLKEHGEKAWLEEGIEWCKKNRPGTDLSSLLEEKPKMACGCPGSMERDFRMESGSKEHSPVNLFKNQASALSQWPVQLHLLNPAASFFQEADLLLASDCSAFSCGNFHDKFLRNRSLAIACPKLDSNLKSYEDKLTALISHSRVNTLTVLIMEVPCCAGLLQIALRARESAKRNIPVKMVKLSIRGEVISEEWM